MKKNNLWIFSFGVAALFAVAFIVMLVVDYVKYYPYGSAPFWLYIAVRFAEFIIPAIAFVVVSVILKKKFYNKPDNENDNK